MPSARELVDRAHSYRNYQPEEFFAALEESSEADVRSALTSVEAGRFEEFLSKVSPFFAKLDRDERETFTQRNPGVVRWMSVWNRVNGFDPYTEWYEQAGDILARPRDVPPFERTNVGGREGLLTSLYTRRRSYRNFSPHEVMEVAQQRFEVTRGQAKELNLWTPEVRQERDDWPIDDVDGKHIVRVGIFPRIESGRMQPMLKAGFYFMAALDPDELKTFTQRNPGIVQWISTYAFAEDLRYGEQLTALTDIEWPVVGEVGNESVDRANDTADRIAQQRASQKREVYDDFRGTASASRKEIREQTSRRVLDRLAGRGSLEVERVSEPGDPVTRLETPAGRLTLPRYADDVERNDTVWARTWDEGDYMVRYSIARGRGEAEHRLRVQRR